jgi:hypothetical protein
MPNSTGWSSRRSTNSPALWTNNQVSTSALSPLRALKCLDDVTQTITDEVASMKAAEKRFQ